MGKQLTASAGALIDDAQEWSGIDWDRARREVRRLQVRIAKAVTTTAGLPHRGSLRECLSRMTGNCHVRF